MRIGFVGLGLMGRGMAANLQKSGHDLVVNDLAKELAAPFLERGGTWADSPCALAETTDLIFTSLPAPADVEKVGFGENGLAKGLHEGTVWFDLSTNAVDAVRRLHAKAAELGVSYLDAPVGGGPVGAASGKLAIWVGGDREVFERRKPVLDAMADRSRGLVTFGDLAAPRSAS